MKKSGVSLLLGQFLKHGTVLPVMDFCNLEFKPDSLLDPGSLLDFYKKYSIVHSLDGEKRGHEVIYFAKLGPPHFLLTSKLTKNMEAGVESGHFIPTDHSLWMALFSPEIELLKRTFCDFLENAGKGFVDIDILNRWLNEVRDIPISFSENKSLPWQPHLSHWTGQTSALDAWLKSKTLSWFLNGQGELFTQIGRCKWCDSFFFRKRSNRQYCSDRCANSYRSRKAAPARAAFMRYYRSIGKAQ